MSSKPPKQPIIPGNGNGDPPPPLVRIFSISPIAAALVGGIDITLTGTGFQPGAEVFFGSSSSPNVTFVSSTTVRATLPAATQTGSVAVSLVNPDGTSATSPGGFTYVTTQQTERAEVLGVTPLTVIEDTETEVTVRGRHLITAFNEGLVALRGPTRVAVTIANVASQRDDATGIETLTFTVRIIASPPLEALERIAIQVLASRRPGAQNDGVVETSTKMFTLLPRARPVPIALTSTLEPDRPTLVVVAGRNLTGATFDLGEGTIVHVQKSDDRTVVGLVSLEGGGASATSKQLSLRNATGIEVAQFEMLVAPAPDAGAGSGAEGDAALTSESNLELTLTPVPNQQVIGPTAEDSKLFSLSGQVTSNFFFDWSNFEITIFEGTSIITIINEVFLIPFFDGGGPELDTPVLAQVGRLFRVRGAALLVALRVHLVIHIQIVLIIGFRFDIWPFGIFNEFFDTHPWAIGSVVIGIRIEINVTLSIHFLLTFVRPDGRLNILFTFNLTIGFDFFLSDDGLRLIFDPDFEYRVLPGGVRPFLNLFPCDGRFQLASENGNTTFIDSLGGSQSFYLPRAAGQCCLPWDFDLSLVRFAPGRPPETVQESFRADFCLTAAPNPNPMDVLIVSDRTPNGFPPPLELELEETAVLRAMARPVDEAGNPVPGPRRDLRDLGFNPKFFLQFADTVLNPATLPSGTADAILDGNNIIRVSLTTPPRVIDVETGEELPFGFWPGAILGFEIANFLAQGLLPGIRAGNLPVTVFPPPQPILVQATVAIDKGQQADPVPTSTIERYEPFETPQDQYILAVKITVPQHGTLPPELIITVDSAQFAQAPLGGVNFAHNRASITEPAKFFTGDLAKNVATNKPQATIPLTLNMIGDKWIPVRSLTIKANPVEVGPDTGPPTLLVPPGRAVMNRDVVLSIGLRAETASMAVQLSTPTLNLTVVNDEIFEEYMRGFVEVQRILKGTGTTITSFRNFAAQFYTALKPPATTPPTPPAPPSAQLLKTKGEELWNLAYQAVQATGTSALMDDRPLYWVRLQAIAALRAFLRHNNLAAPTQQVINQFEWPSRGLEQIGGAISFPAQAAGSRKAIVTGFDPFQLPSEPGQSNPSGLIALYFNAKPAGSTDAPVFVRTAVIPVRYRDFDTGLIEAVVGSLDSTVMIMTTSQNNFHYYDVERFACRTRLGATENENKRANQIPGSGDHYVESTLPYARVITSARTLSGPQGATPFVIDQSYQIQPFNVDLSAKRRPPSTPPIPLPTEELRKVHLEPKEGERDGFEVSSDKPQDNTALTEGSGGSYLSNEIFYRTAAKRKSVRPSLASGHLHVPPTSTNPQSTGQGLVNGVKIALDEFLVSEFRLRGSGNITFPRTDVNTTSAPITLTATNDSMGTTVSISAVEVAVPFAVQLPSQIPIAVGPNSSVALPLTFRPTAAGVQTGNVKLRSADGELLLTAALTGEGAPVFSIGGLITIGDVPRQGVQVALTGSSTASATTGADGRYSFPDLSSGGNYTVTPSLANHTFTPPSQTINGLAANQTADFTGTLNRRRIRGRVITAAGTGIPGTTVTLSGAQSATTTTDATGEYAFNDLPAEANYVVSVSRVNYGFTPTSQTFNNLTVDMDFDFAGTLNSHTISGRVTSDAAGLIGVTVSLGGSQSATATTDSNGDYSFTVFAEGNYTLTPSRPNYTFAPSSTTFNNLGANQTANFNATLNTHRISGRVVNIQGISQANVTITLSGPLFSTTTTDSQGSYSFPNVPAGGNYIVTPSASGFTFTPQNRAFNNLSADQIGDFSSTPVVIGRANVALESNGATATASSTLDLGRLPRAAINGDRRGLHWGTDPATGSGWHDATPDVFPDWIEIAFAGQNTISEVHVFTVQDDVNNPVDPTEEMIFSQFGIQDFDVEKWNEAIPAGRGLSIAAWELVPGGAIVDNNKVWRKIAFAPLTTTKIRVTVKRALAGHSRIVEVEAWQATPVVNYALESNGATATASSIFNLSWVPGNAINGDRRGPAHWHDATIDTFPDWLEVAFPGPRTIHEISVFSVQDNAIAPELPPEGEPPPVTMPEEPTEQMTFTQFGLQDFDLEYWTVSAWQIVPGGAIVNNDKVWRKVTFAPVTTTKIRVLVKRGVAGFSRIVEVEVWG